jgi:lactoylglutathione lyase
MPKNAFRQLYCTMKFRIRLLPVLVCLLFISQSLFSQKKAVLNHIAIYVKDLAVSTAFYQKIVMLDTISEPFHDGRHTWFSIGAVGHLHLIQGAASLVEHDKNGHLCFSVPSVEEVIARLDKNNIGYESWPGVAKTMTTRVDGIKQIYFKDPDGYWIEINDDYPKN